MDVTNAIITKPSQGQMEEKEWKVKKQGRKRRIREGKRKKK